MLSLATVKRYEAQARAREVSTVARGPRGFTTAYKHGNIDESWCQKRSGFIARHMAQIEQRGEALFDRDGRPTRRHLALIMWAFSPTPKKL